MDSYTDRISATEKQYRSTGNLRYCGCDYSTENVLFDNGECYHFKHINDFSYICSATVILINGKITHVTCCVHSQSDPCKIQHWETFARVTDSDKFNYCNYCSFVDINGNLSRDENEQSVITENDFSRKFMWWFTKNEEL